MASHNLDLVLVKRLLTSDTLVLVFPKMKKRFSRTLVVLVTITKWVEKNITCSLVVVYSHPLVFVS